MFRRSFVLMLAMAASLALLNGCALLNRQAEEVTLRVAALRGPTGVGMVKMLEEQPSLGANVEVEYSVAETPDIMVSRILNKEVDIAALPTNLAAKLYNAGHEYQLLAINTWGNLFVVSNGIEINDWADLRGKTINSIGVGATPDLVFRALLQANGLEPDRDVTIDYSMSQVELAGAMTAGRVRLAILPEPLVTTVTMNNSDVQIVLSLEDGWKAVKGEDMAIAQGCLVVRKDFAASHPGVVSSFLAKYEESIAWVNENLEEAGALIEAHGLGMPARVAQVAIPRTNIRYESATNAQIAIEAYLEALLDIASEAVGGKLPDEGFYYGR